MPAQHLATQRRNRRSKPPRTDPATGGMRGRNHDLRGSPDPEPVPRAGRPTARRGRTGQARAPGRVDLRPPATSAGTPGPARPAGRRPRKTPRNPSQGRGMLIPMTVRGTSAVLVGREAELATLRAALKRADTTEPVTVLLG